MISFIIIGKNEGERLYRCLASIYNVVDADDLTEYEVIYVDSKSVDGSVEYVKENFREIKIFSITGECNAAVARNIGFKESCGEILFFIDGDMQLLPGSVKIFLKDNETLIHPFCTGRFDNYVHDKNWNFIKKAPGNYKELGGEITYQPVTGGLFIIERWLWKKVEGMDTRFIRSQDIDLGLKISKLGILQMKIPHVIVNHFMIDYLDEKRIKAFKALKVSKYRGMLFRRNVFNINYYRYAVRNDYSSYILFISFICSLFSVYFIFFYVLALLLRISFIKYRKARNINILLFLKDYFFRDVMLYWSFVAFFPKVTNEEYEKIN